MLCCCCCYLVIKSCLTLFDPVDYTACHAPPSIVFPRQEYRSGFPFPSSGNLLDWGIKLKSPALAGRFFTTELPGKPLYTTKSLQSCPTLCSPMDGSTPGSPVPGVLQTRTLEWVAISFSSAWKWKMKEKSLSRVRPSATPWTAAHQAPPSMGYKY